MKLLSTETTGAESAASDGSSGDGSKPLTADCIQWLTKEQTFVIVYLVSDNNYLTLAAKLRERGYSNQLVVFTLADSHVC